MKQTLLDYIKQNEDLRKILLAQDGGIMKYWAEHPDADFDVDLFEGYENEIMNAYLQANKQNRAVRSLPKDELRRRSLDWYQLKESELKFFVDMKPALNAFDTEVPEEVLNHIEIYLADAYKESHRCKYPEGMPPLDFYNNVVEQYNAFGLAIDCLERVLQQCRGKAVKLTVKHFFLNVIAQQGGTPEWDEVNNLQAEFDMRMFKQTFYAEGSYKKLRKAVEELIVNCTQNLAGEECRKVCREMAKEEMRKFYQFTRWVNNETYPMEKSKGGKYVPLITPEERHWLRNIMYENSPGATGKEELTTMGRYYCDFDHILQHIGTIWAAQLLVRGIDMKELEKETGIILSRLPDSMYYVDRDLDDRRGDCCVYDFKQAKMLLEQIPKENAEELNGDLASRLKTSIEELVKNINNQPEQVNCIGKIIAKSKFDWSIMVAIICGLKEDWLMDKAIQIIEDKWKECANKKEDCCYQTIGHIPDYGFDGIGMYKKDQPLKMLKYIDIKKALEGAKADELKRRKISKKFETEIKKRKKSKSGNTRPPREHVDIKKATHSFIYKPNGLSERERNKRLVTFFDDLCSNSKYTDADSEWEVFLKRFTGVHTAEKLLWTAEYKQLLYLIRKLHDAGVLTWNSEKPKPGIQQMICIVFQILDNDYVEVDDKFDKEKAKHIHDIEVSNLNTSIDDKDEGLDPIIQKLIVKDKDELSGSIEEDVSDMFSELQSGN